MMKIILLSLCFPLVSLMKIGIRSAGMTTHHPSWPPKNLYDGNYGSFAHSDTSQCANTGGEFQFTLYLSDLSQIGFVKIYMRDANGRMNGIFVYTAINTVEGTEEKCGPINGGNKVDMVQCTGGYVDVVKLRGTAHFCEIDLAEVEVFGRILGMNKHLLPNGFIDIVGS